MGFNSGFKGLNYLGLIELVTKIKTTKLQYLIFCNHTPTRVGQSGALPRSFSDGPKHVGS